MEMQEIVQQQDQESQKRNLNGHSYDPTSNQQRQEELNSELKVKKDPFKGEAIMIATRIQPDISSPRQEQLGLDQREIKIEKVKRGASSKKIKNQPENTKDILFENLDQAQFNWKPYAYFSCLYLINATIILIIFIIWSIYELLHTIFCTLLSKNFSLYLKTIFAYIIDILMAISVLWMYPLALMKTPGHYPVNFQYWAISSLIFTQSFILLQSYVISFDTDPDKLEVSWEKLKENMINLGLGKLMKKVRANQVISEEKDEIEEQKLYFKEVINKSIDSENIDDTLFFFALDSDVGISTTYELHYLNEDVIRKWMQKIKQNQEISNSNNFQSLYDNDPKEIEKKVEVLNLIHKQGFRGNRHIIDNFLWPHFRQMNQNQELSIYKTIAIFFFVLSLKVAYPVYAILTHIDQIHLVSQFIILLNFMGCYMNMIFSLYGLLLNDDLQGKKYILNVLETLIIPKKQSKKQQQKTQQGNEEEEDEEEDDGDNVVNERFKIDLTCNISLESWDNARRLTLMLDQEKLNQYETTFSFLAIYLLYTYIILSQDFLGFDLFPTLHKFFRNPIQEYNTIVDFILVSLLFLIRVDEGSKYNATFKVDKLEETVKKFKTVLSEKKQLFDFYFNNDIIYSIENDIYRNLTQKIYCTSADKLLYTLVDHQVEDIEVENFKSIVKQLSKKRVLQLCATMEKLVQQMEFDGENHCHKFLGLFKSDIMKVFSTFGILIYIFFHSKIKKYLKKHQKGQKPKNNTQANTTQTNITLF